MGLLSRFRSFISHNKKSIKRAAVAFGVVASFAAGSVAVRPQTAKAESLGYPHRNLACVHSPYNVDGRCGTSYDARYANTPLGPDTRYEWGTTRNNRSSTTSTRGFAYRNCTDYVSWKLIQSGVPATIAHNYSTGKTKLGHAKNWVTAAPQRGVTVNTSPAVGAAAISTTGTFGHVAYIEAVTSTTVTISEYNAAGTGDGVRSTITRAAFASRFSRVAHFEIKRPTQNPAPNNNTPTPTINVPFNPAAWNGRIIRDNTTGQSWYVVASKRRLIATSADWYCYTQTYKVPYYNREPAIYNKIPLDTVVRNAHCNLQTYFKTRHAGQIVRDSQTGAAFLMNANGYRYHIPTGSHYNCFVNIRKVPVYNYSTAVLQRVPRIAGDTKAYCPNIATYFNGKILRDSSTGTAWLVLADGKRHWIPGSNIYNYYVNNERRQVINTNSHDFNRVPDAGTAWAWGNLPGYVGPNIVKDKWGTAWLVSGTQLLWIPTTNVQNYYISQGKRVFNLNDHELTRFVNRGARTWGNLGAYFNGKIVKNSSGNSWLISSNVRYSIPTGRIYDYYVGYEGRQVVTLTQDEINSIPHSGSNANGNLGAWFTGNIVRRTSDGASWFLSNGTRYYIDQGIDYICYQRQGKGVYNLNDYEIGTIPDNVGARARCDVRSYMNGTIVRDPNGTAWAVENGIRRWIPPTNWGYPYGGAWNCYANKRGWPVYTMSGAEYGRIPDGGEAGWARTC